MIDINLAKAIAREFIESFDSAFLNPVINSAAVNNLVTDEIIFDFPEEVQVFGSADTVLSGGQYGGIDTPLVGTAGTIGDFFNNALTRYFPVANTEVYEYLMVAGEDDPAQDRIALRVKQEGTGSQTGRPFEQPATYIIEIDEEAVNSLDEATVQALLDGTFDSLTQSANVIRRVEFYANLYNLHAAVLDSPYGTFPVPDNDPLTFQPAYRYDPEGDSAAAIEVATQVWTSLIADDIVTPSELHAADAVWSFAITGPDFLPYVGTAQGYTTDGQILAADFSNVGPILSDILAELFGVVDGGDLQIVGTYAEGNRVLVHLREGENELPVALETGNAYRAPLELLSWLTVEDGKVVSNEVIVNTFATVSALRPEETSPFAYALGNTRHAPPYFVTGSRVNSGIVSFDRFGNYNGILYETNAFDAPELQLPIGITYGGDGRLYVNSTLGSIDNTPIINAVLTFAGVHGNYEDGTTQANRTARDRARDAVTANEAPRLQNIDPTRVADDPNDPEDQPNDYNAAIFGNAHGEFYDPATGDLLDPGSLTVVSFASGLNTAAARPIDFANETIRTIIDPTSGAEGFVFADGENPTFAYAVPVSGTTPVAILDLTTQPPSPIAILDPLNPASNNFVDPEDIFSIVYTFDPETNVFTPVDPEGTTLTFNSLTDPRIVFTRDGEGSPLGFVPVGLAIPGLVIPSGIKYGFGLDDNLYVASAFTSRILQYDGETGEFLSVFATRENGIPVANLLDPAEGLPPDFTVFVFGPDGAIYQCSIRTDISPTTGTFETETYYAGVGGNLIQYSTEGPDRTNMDSRNGYGAVLRFPGPTWAKDPATGWYIDPLNGNLVEPGHAAGIATARTDLTDIGVFGETGGILSEQVQPLFEPSAVAFGPDLRMYVSSAQTGEVLVYEGPVLADGSPNPNAGRYVGVYANVGQAVKEETGRLDEIVVLSGLGFGPDGNLYVGSSFEQPDDGSPNAGAPVAGSQWSVVVGPNPWAFGQSGTPGTYLGAFGQANTEISRLLLPTTPEFVYYSNSYTHYNDPTERFPEIYYVLGVNTDRSLDDSGTPGFFQDDKADAIAAYDRNMNFLGYLGTPLTNGKLGQDITPDTNPLSGIGDIILGPSGDILVSSQLTDEILRYSSLTGQYLGVFGDASAEGLAALGIVGLDFPSGMALGAMNAVNVNGTDGQRSGLFVSDLNNGRILRFDGYSGQFGDDLATDDVNEGIVAQLGEDRAGWRFTDIAYGPDGRLYVGLNCPLDNPALGSGVIQVYNPENNTLEQEITGFDFVAALTFGPDNRLYVADDPASLIDPLTGQPLDPNKESRVAIYTVDYVYPLLTDPDTGASSPTGVREAPVLVNSFNVGIGNAGAITVTTTQNEDELVVLLSEPASGNVAAYSTEGEALETLNPALPTAAGGIDEDGIARPTGSAFITEFLRASDNPTLNYAPLAVVFTNSIVALAEDTDTREGVKVADISILDDGLGTNVLSLSGDDASSFEIRENALYFTGESLDYETKSSYSVAVNVDDESVGSTPDASATFTLSVTALPEPGVNKAPTAVVLSNLIATLVENTSTLGGIKVADISIVDDGLGTNVLSLSGEDAGSFEIRDNALYFIGESLDYESRSGYQVVVNVDDESVGASPDASSTLTLTVTNLADQNVSDRVTRFDDGTDGDGFGKLVYDFSDVSGNVEVRANDDDLKQTDALFHNLAGIYEVLDADGAILDRPDIDGDGDTSERLLPGDSGYARAALANAVTDFVLQAGGNGDPVKNTDAEEFGDVLLQGGRMYAPFVIANGGDLIPTGGQLAEGLRAFLDRNPDNIAATLENVMSHAVAYFSFAAANPDGGSEHLQKRGNNVFGFEDLPGNLNLSDRDFNDGIFSFTFTG